MLILKSAFLSIYLTHQNDCNQASQRTIFFNHINYLDSVASKPFSFSGNSTNQYPEEDIRGCEFSRQWPKMEHIFLSPRLETHSAVNPRVLVSEKYDGSNLAVSSEGVVASRRTVLLVRPCREDLINFTFQSAPLATLDGIFERLLELKKGFASLIPSNVSLKEVLVYGELILKGTATGKEDRYGYRNKGYSLGDLLIFGVGLTFEKLKDEKLAQNMTTNLEEQGFHIFDKINTTYFMAMSPKLKKLLDKYNIGPSVEQKEMAFSDLAKTFKKSLLDQSIEGVVVSFGSELVKWKSALSCQQWFQADVEETRGKVDEETYEAFKAVVGESVSSSRKNKPVNSRLENQLETALISAKTKMRDLKEHLEDGGSTDEYIKKIEIEMLNDANGSIAFRKQVHSFVSSRVIQPESIK